MTCSEKFSDGFASENSRSTLPRRLEESLPAIDEPIVVGAVALGGISPLLAELLPVVRKPGWIAGVHRLRNSSVLRESYVSERRLVVGGRCERAQQSADQRARENRTRVEMGAATEGPAAGATNRRTYCAYVRTELRSRHQSRCEGRRKRDPLRRRMGNALAI